ncbi:hypothetical protein BCR35DRAFT_309318 [Leucosporidium creatinivorum]|uniref:Chromatin assembly factor 1 subunit A-domain-containing protein n=1 Tax=Leucosporidium creatinivorum TaxID=106004 RepID=A0A1Y2DJM6_9BASI|nr:hypothetical protein BCR35DRAFT_309318 [Leucosporidium creatinivorum]
MASPQASTSALPFSSPHSNSSTPASSTLNSALKQDPVQLDSDMEILEERNGSPAATKRKAQDPAEASDVEVKKKPKVAVSTPQSKSASKSSTNDSANKKATPSTSKDEAALVELKNGKLVTKQKPLKLKEAGSAVRARLAFTDYVAERFQDEEAKLDEWPKEHHSIVAALIHESSQTLTGLVTSTKNGVVEYIQGAQGVVEDSQEEDEEKTRLSIAARVPTAPIKALIESIASRNNYGLEVSDLPDGLPEGVSEVPAGLQLPSWEVHDEENLPAEFESKLTKRKADRVQIKSLATELFLALPSDEQNDLLHSKKSSKSKASGTPVASTSKKADTGSSAAKPKAVKKEKIKKEKTAEELAEEEEKAKAKREKEKEKEIKRIAKEQADMEKEAKKAAKAKEQAEKQAKQAEKQAKQEKAQAANNKQQSMFSAFLVKGGSNLKKSASPVPEASSSGKISDFNRFFHPFTVRSGVVQAPINAFPKAGKTFSVTPNSDETLTAKDALHAFLSKIPKHHIIPHNPHPVPPVSVRQTVVAINESLVTGMDPRSYYDVLKDRKKVPIKLLKFCDDVRPGYVGTWTKTSRIIGPRTPLQQDDALLNYAVDSEEEWEEEGEDPDAEDVGSGGEGSDDDDGDDSEALSDDWMCDDDEIEFEPGHDGEDEMMLPPPGDDDLIIVGDSAARRKVEEREKKRKAAREGAKKKQAVGPLIALVKGPVWEEKIGQTPYVGFSSMKIEMLNGAPVGLDPLTYVSKSFVQSASAIVKGKGVDKDVKPLVSTSGDPSSPSGSTTGGKDKAASKPVKPIPSHLMPQFIRLVETSDKTTKPLLVAELVDGLKEVAGDTKVTKVMIEGAIKNLPVNKVKAKEEAPNGAKWTIPQAVKDLYDSAPAPMVVD